jgi:hypothetical protein
MVRHAVAKKRRRGGKITIKPRKHRQLRVTKAITDKSIKLAYDKSKSPSENLENFGLLADANNFKKQPPAGGTEKKCAAFVGYAEVASLYPKEKKKVSRDERDYALACMAKYGNDYSLMQQDIDVNYNQLTAHKLSKLCGAVA